MNHNHPQRYFIKTFGCQMNEHDSAKMSMLLRAEGYIPEDDIKKADIILFNTCTIREKSHHKAISEVGRALKLKGRRPDLIVGMTGCVAQEEGGNLFELFPDLDLALGPDQIHKLTELLRKVMDCRGIGVKGAVNATDLVDDYKSYRFVSYYPTTDDKLIASGTRILPTTTDDGRQTTSFVTIMKGCNNFCSFCIVPYVRGREVSRSPEEIVAEIKSLCAEGVKEVTLLGQNVNSYGKDRSEFGTFPRLLRRIAEETEISRLRYTSPHPKDLSNELILEHKSNALLCEHIHLPVQAGSTSELKRMNRVYSREDYIERVEKIRSVLPTVSVTTDIIVGFPGETDEEFEETLDLMRSIKFDGMFAFKYSERPGTTAAEKYRDDVPEEVKLSRLSQVLELNETIVLQKNKNYVGTMQEVLVEGSSKRGGDQLTGRTRTNKIVNFEGEMGYIGTLLNLEITDAGPNSLKGRIL